MSEKQLLEGLIDVAKAQQIDEREASELAAWQKGQLSAEQGAALEQRLDERDAELFRPIDADKKAELARRVREQLGQPAAVAEMASAKVLPFPRKTWPWFTAIAASVLVAGLAGRSFLTSPALPELPKYALSISSGALEQRGDPAPSAEVPTFSPNTSVQAVLRPEHEISGAAAVRAFLVQGDRWVAWSPPNTVDPSGSILIEGRASQLFAVEPGPWTMVFVLARPDVVDETAKRVASGARKPSDVVLEQKIVVAGE